MKTLVGFTEMGVLCFRTHLPELVVNSHLSDLSPSLKQIDGQAFTEIAIRRAR